MSAPGLESLFGPESEEDARFDQCLRHLYLYRLSVRTLAGNQFFLEGLPAHALLDGMTSRVAEHMGVPPFTVKLIVGQCSRSVDSGACCADGATLLELGLDAPGAYVVALRRPGSRAEWAFLFTELVHAIRCGRSEEARRLVNFGAGFDDEGQLLRAANSMQRPGDFTVDAPQIGNTMLHLAIREGLTDLALYLISRRVDIEATNDAQRSPLVQAVARKQDQVSLALIECGASVGTTDYLGNTALAYALMHGNDELAAQLLSRTSCLEERDAFLRTAPSKMPQTAKALFNTRDAMCDTDAGTSSSVHRAQSQWMVNVAEALLA